MKRAQLTLLCAASLLSGSGSALAGQEGMSDMPLIQPKKSYTISTDQQGEELLEHRGYGDDEPRVRMMMLMMVSGSGMEGMEMGTMPEERKKKQPPSEEKFVVQSTISPQPPQSGPNLLSLTITTRDGKPASGLKIKAKVHMTSMAMGMEEPAVVEKSPGKYQLKANFAMEGPWAVKVQLPQGEEKVFTFNVGSSGN